MSSDRYRERDPMEPIYMKLHTRIYKLEMWAEQVSKMINEIERRTRPDYRGCP